jgi:hypothetical protein
MCRLFTAFVLMFCLVTPAFSALDGAFLVKCLDAADKVERKQDTSSEEYGNSMLLIGMVTGVVAAHRQNNFFFSLLTSPEAKQLSPDALRVASAFVPLLRLPAGFSMPQAFAILRKYLMANPGRWHESAPVLIEVALREAFAG